MKLLLAVLLIPLLSNSDCTPKNKIPSCILSVIDQPESANKPVQIDEYLYEGKKVFLYTAPCCDQYNTLYTADCNPICSPTGGLTGKGDGKCPEFNVTATHVKLVWKKS